MKTVTVKQALQHVADYPEPVSDDLTIMPAWEMVARVLYDTANGPDKSVRGSFGRANKARKMIMDRLVGKRRKGTRPASAKSEEIEFADLTGGAVTDGSDIEEVLQLDR